MTNHPRSRSASVQASTTVDAFLVTAGAATAALTGPHPAGVVAGVFMVGLGLLSFLTRRGARSSIDDQVVDLVPDEILEAHAAVHSAGKSLGEEGRGALETADRLVLEAAALLGGRPPRGYTQTTFVIARTTALRAMAEDLADRDAALRAARDELAAMSADVDRFQAAIPAADRTGVFVRSLVLILLPLTLVWDALAFVIRLPWTLLLAVAFRLRLAWRHVVLILAALGRVFDFVGDELLRLRQVVVDDVRSARLRTRALRLQVRLQLQRRSR